MSDRCTIFKLLVPFPISVHGGITTWKITYSRWGKNGTKREVVATCAFTGESITIISGRDGMVDNSIANGLYIERGTKLHLIFSKLVRTRRATVVDGFAS